VHPRKTAGADIQNGVSVDQIAAAHLAGPDALRVAGARVRRLADRRQLRFRLFLRLHQQPVVARPGHADAARDESAAWCSSACSATSTRAFRQTCGRGGCCHRRSILDLVTDRTSRLMRDLGPTDRRKLDEYLTSVREIETRIERAEKDPTASRRASTSRPASRCSTKTTST
jgi:hypothetical protein